MSDSSEEEKLPPGVDAVLRHPSGVDVFIVGVAHVSQKVRAHRCSPSLHANAGNQANVVLDAHPHTSEGGYVAI